MSTPVTVALTVRAYLLTTLAAAVQGQTQDGRTLDVIDSYPLEATPNDELVVGDFSVQWKQSLIMGGYVAGSREESGDVTLSISSYGFGSEDPSQTLLNAQGWLELVTAALDADPTLGGNVFFSQLSNASFVTEANEEGPITSVELKLEYRAQI